MKTMMLILCLVCGICSCQNQVEANKLDWIKKIDKTIKKYEKKSKIEDIKTLVENNQTLIYSIYNKDSQGFHKIKGVLKDDKMDVDVINEVYMLNDEIVLEQWSGLFPLLYKGQKKETDPCCELFNRVIYFKDSLEGKVYIKQLKIFEVEEKNKCLQELNSLPFEEDDRFNIANEYLRVKEQLEELKQKLK
jgi:hypothetical protein